jgi:hypothetical protein
MSTASAAHKSFAIDRTIVTTALQFTWQRLDEKSVEYEFYRKFVMCRT